MNQDLQLFTHTTLANDAANELEWITVAIPIDVNTIKVGTNTIAVELHQNVNTSSDAHFNMEIIISPDVVPAPVRVAAQEVAIPNNPTTILYPNPTENGKVFFTESIPYETVRILDTRGVLIRYISEPGVLNELDVSALPVGTFILSTQNKDKVIYFKIVKKE